MNLQLGEFENFKIRLAKKLYFQIIFDIYSYIATQLLFVHLDNRTELDNNSIEICRLWDFVFI